MEIMDHIRAKHLLNQIRAIKDYTICVEADLESFLGGVGTAQRDKEYEAAKKQGIDVDAIRARARKKFSKQ